MILICIFIFTGCSQNNISEKNTEKTEIKKITTVGRYVELLDNKVAKIDIMDPLYEYDTFELYDDVKTKIQKGNYKQNTLIAINFVLEKDKTIPVITQIEKIDKTQVKAVFNGMADNNFAEFKIGNKIFVFQISDKLKDAFNDIKEGSDINITIKPSETPEGNMVVVEINNNL